MSPNTSSVTPAIPIPRFGQTRPLSRPLNAASATHDSVYFGSNSAAQAQAANEHPPSFGERMQGATKAAGKSLTSGTWWLTQLGISSAITLATCWLPGSQLITIPIWLAIASAFQAGSAAIEGYKHPREVDKEAEALRQDRTGMQSDLTPGQGTSSNKTWSYPERAVGAFKGAGKQVSHDFVSHFLQNAAIGGLITLATCWLPGSQLLTIPAWFCMDSAISAVTGGARGWNNPDYSPSQENNGSSQEPGKTKTE